MTGVRIVLGSMGVYLVILGLEMETFELELDRREEPDVLELERLLDPDELDLERRFVAASDNSIITTTINDRNSTVVIRIVLAPSHGFGSVLRNQPREICVKCDTFSLLICRLKAND